MNQLDFVGNLPLAQATPGPGNTRPSSAEEKATLLMQLGRLAHRVPECVRNGSIQKTREWVTVQKQAIALCANTRASVPQLTACLANLKRFY